jgi:hypothetical protein
MYEENMKRASGSTCSRGPGRQKKRQIADLLGDLRQAGEREEVGEGAVRLLDGQLEHLAPERGEDDRDPELGRPLELEATVRALAREGGAEEVDRLRHLRERLLERHPVPALDDPVRGRPDAEGEATARCIGDGRGLLGEQSPASLHDPDHAGAEAHVLGPGRRERERGEAVRAVGLAAPQVGVARRLGPLEELLVLGQADSRERNGQSPSLSHNRDPTQNGLPLPGHPRI